MECQHKYIYGEWRGSLFFIFCEKCGHMILRGEDEVTRKTGISTDYNEPCFQCLDKAQIGDVLPWRRDCKKHNSQGK